MFLSKVYVCIVPHQPMPISVSLSSLPTWFSVEKKATSFAEQLLHTRASGDVPAERCEPMLRTTRTISMQQWAVTTILAFTSRAILRRSTNTWHACVCVWSHSCRSTVLQKRIRKRRSISWSISKSLFAPSHRYKQRAKYQVETEFREPIGL